MSSTRRRVADVIVQILIDHGMRDVFMLTGGGAMHLNDAFGRRPELRKIFNHHEQASSIAAESYGRMSGKLAVLNVTTGPGGVNALNGVYGAYVDSIGMIVVSGQVKRETYAPNFPIALRQLGEQEIDIVSMVRGITKYAVTLQDPTQVRVVMEKAIWLASRGRPGPVWVDVPMDVQGMLVDPDALPRFDPASDASDDGVAPNTHLEENALSGAALEAEVRVVLEELAAAKRPVIFPGGGVRIANAYDAFVTFVERLGVPVITAFNAHDLLPHDHPLYAGRPGTIGDRAGNFVVQNADYVLVLGCRLSMRQISYNWDSFARHAKVAMVEVDGAELAKPTLHLHRPIHAELKDFLTEANRQLALSDRRFQGADYVPRCKALVARYPVVLDEYWRKPAPVNPYCFGQTLFDRLEEGDIVISGDGTACVTIFQSARIKPGQRLYSNGGCASMGYDLPAAIGAYYATGARRIVCIAGDGSIMMNLQELQTIAGGRLPIKVFVLNNDGYHSMRQTQENYFPDNIVGCGPESGLTFPDFARLAQGFAIPSSRIADHAGLSLGIADALAGEGPHLCEVMIDRAQAFAPKLLSRRLDDGTMVSPALEDMAPFLPREEMAENMFVEAPAA
jgi:acetolactate synthase I/II/III large subunit